jgi:hypothetical protein
MFRTAARLSPLALAALALFAAPASGALGEGDTPPCLEGQEFINTEEITFDALIGRVVLCEVFAPG